MKLFQGNRSYMRKSWLKLKMTNGKGPTYDCVNSNDLKVEKDYCSSSTRLMECWKSIFKQNRGRKDIEREYNRLSVGARELQVSGTGPTKPPPSDLTGEIMNIISYLGKIE